MNQRKRCKMEHSGHCHKGNEKGRGPSSFTMHDFNLVFDQLNLKEGEVFLDMGCGAGDYSFYAAQQVGGSGFVYALDIGEESLKVLNKEASGKGIENLETIVSDICNPLPVKDHCVDVYFIATVLHTLDLNQVGEHIFDEMHRILKPGGRLAIVECKKEDLPFGPPIHMRYSPEEIERIAVSKGFEKMKYVDLGYNYMIQFKVV